jgi:hypothetical protein
MDDNVSNDGNGTTGDDLDDDGDDIDDDCDGATGDEVHYDGDLAKLSSPSMRRRLHRRRDSVSALVVVALLPSPMRRRLDVVDDDGDGVTGDDDYDDFEDATDFAVVAMALLPSSRWCFRCTGVLPLSKIMTTAQRVTKSTMTVMARQAMTSTMMAHRDGSPRENPSNGGGSDVSRVIREFGMGEIHASTVVVVDPLASPPSSPPSDAWCALLATAAPAAKQLGLQR